MQKIASHYGRLIVGATFAGLGDLLARPGDALLVESTATVGWEFIEAYRPGVDWERTAGLNEAASDLRRELVERNILEADRVHLPALSPVLHQRLDRSGADYLFLTDVLAVEPGGSGYDVTLATRSGLKTVSVRRILDTTTHLLTRPGQEVIIESKRIGANLNLRQGEPFDGRPVYGDRFALTPGRFGSEAFLSLALPVEATWTAAREALHRFWLARPAPLGGWDLASVATRLDETPVRAELRAENWLHLPSTAHDNPLRAFAAGAGVMATQGV